MKEEKNSKETNEEKVISIQKRIALKMIPEAAPEELKENILEWVTFRSELSKESDRGCALLAASHLDFLIEELLKVKMVGTKKQIQSLFDFNGPMGTFSSRILISYSIGLISKSYVNDLQIIRKVRNEFGHSPSIINFDDEKIASFCNNLFLIDDSNRANKAKFITSVAFLSGSLMGLAFKESKFKERLDIDLDKTKRDNKEFREALYKQFKSSKKESNNKKS